MHRRGVLIRRIDLDVRQAGLPVRLQQASAQLEKPARIRTLRKDIARMKTIARQRELEGGQSPAAPPVKLAVKPAKIAAKKLEKK